MQMRFKATAIFFRSTLFFCFWMTCHLSENSLTRVTTSVMKNKRSDVSCSRLQNICVYIYGVIVKVEGKFWTHLQKVSPALLFRRRTLSQSRDPRLPVMRKQRVTFYTTWW